MAIYSAKQIVKYSVVFGQELLNSADLLHSLDKSTAVKIITRLNHLARTRQLVSVDDVLNMWFGNSNREFKKLMRGKIISGYLAKQTKIENLNIISMWSNLRLLDIILAEPVQHTQKPDEESERDFFKVYLAVNEEFGKGSDQLVHELKHEEKDFTGWYSRQLMATLIKYHDFANVTFEQVVNSQIIKTYHCFRFLLSNGHQELVRMVLDTYGVKTWQEYFQFILPICYNPINNGDGSGLFYFKLQEGNDLPKRLKFISQLSLDADQSYPVLPDFIHIRSRPLYETEPGRFLVTDTILTNNRVHNSLFWELKNIAERNKHLHPDYKNFFTFFTTYYVEKYLAYTLLDELYGGTSYYRLSGQQIKDIYDIDLEPDYYVRNGKKAFLFEVKGSMILGSAKQTFEYTKLEAELKLKYYMDPKTGKRIGILQLVDRIKVLLSKTKQVIYDTGAASDSLRIYPILLVTERSLTTPGMNMIFNEWFQDALAKEPELTGKSHQIQPLTILDMDSLINFMELFKSKPAILEKAMLEYHQFVKGRKPNITNKKTKAQLKLNMNLCQQSFPEFLESHYKSPQPALSTKIVRDII